MKQAEQSSAEQHSTAQRLALRHGQGGNKKKGMVVEKVMVGGREGKRD